MTSAIDTNILVALWDAEDALHREARQLLESAFSGGRLVICGLVYAELLAAPGRTEAFLDKFFEETGVGVAWEIEEKIWREAGNAFQGYVARRRKRRGTEPRRILADFLIGAHASMNGYRLLTLDAGLYQMAFPKLVVETI
jgi:predicted nucleic acid-binding protein